MFIVSTNAISWPFCLILHRPVSNLHIEENTFRRRWLSLTVLGIFLAGDGDHLSQGDDQAESNPRAKIGAHVWIPDMQRSSHTAAATHTRKSERRERVRPRATASRLRKSKYPWVERLLDERLLQTETSSLFTPSSHSPPPPPPRPLSSFFRASFQGQPPRALTSCLEKMRLIKGCMKCVHDEKRWAEWWCI